MFRDERFFGIAARIGARHETVLTSSQWDRLFSTPNLSEAVRIFRELPFYSGSLEIEKPEDFEILLSEALHETREFLLQYTKDEEFLKAIMLPYDLQNTKISLRAFLLGKDYEMIHDKLTPLGFFPYHTAFFFLKEMEEDLPHRSPLFLKKALKEAEKQAKEFPEEPQAVEEILNIAFFSEMAKAIRNCGIASLTAYAHRYIDAENIRRLVRRFPQKSDEKMLFFSPFSRKMPSLLLSREEAWSRLSVSPLFSFLKESQALSSLEEKMLWERKLLLAPLTPIHQESAISSLSSEKVVRYFFQRVGGVELLRTLFVGKMSHHSPEKLRAQIFPLFLALQS